MTIKILSLGFAVCRSPCSVGIRSSIRRSARHPPRCRSSLNNRTVFAEDRDRPHFALIKDVFTCSFARVSLPSQDLTNLCTMSLAATQTQSPSISLRNLPHPTLASSTSAIIMTSGGSRETDDSPLRSICRDVRRRVDKFLSSDPPTEVLRATQRQTRESIAVIEEALARYP